MYFSTAVVAAFAATYVSASPLMMARGNTCGAAPAGSNTNNQPISQLSGIHTSAACQAQCEANSSCKSFCFGLVDNTIECKLYSCAASAVPTQSSTNLVVYDRACSAVPSVVPSTSNPTGKKVDSSQTQSNTNSGSKTSEQKTQESKKASASKSSAQKAAESNQAEISSTNDYSTQKQASSTQKESSSTQKDSSASKSSVSTCGTKPSASTNNQPISSPSVTSQEACKAKCESNSSCNSFTCGEVDNAVVCKLYSVAAGQIPAPTNAAQKSALKAYDVGCSI